jgi:hypothetical protein
MHAKCAARGVQINMRCGHTVGTVRMTKGDGDDIELQHFHVFAISLFTLLIDLLHNGLSSNQTVWEW